MVKCRLCPAGDKHIPIRVYIETSTNISQHQHEFKQIYFNDDDKHIIDSMLIHLIFFHHLFNNNYYYKEI